MQWMNEPTCTPAARLLNRQICHLCLTLRDLLISGTRKQGSLGNMLTFCRTRRERTCGYTKSRWITFFRSKMKRRSESVDICLGEPGGRQILAADVQVNSLWVNQLLMHADNSQLWQHLTAYLPSISTHSPFNKCCPFIWNWMWQPSVISL